MKARITARRDMRRAMGATSSNLSSTTYISSRCRVVQ
jgi:hypothetical protein